MGTAAHSDEAIALAARWDALADEARKTSLGSHTLAVLAKSVGKDWYRARGHESLSDFLELTGEQLFQLHGFGKTKVRRLSMIVELHLNGSGDGKALVGLGGESKSDPAAALEEWAIPAHFPLKLITLPVRILNFCDLSNITDIAGLIALWGNLGFDGLKRLPNLGRKSVSELQEFMMALAHRNATEAARFLPISGNGSGLSASKALVAVLRDLNELEKDLLEKRIRDGMTLEQSAEARELTRERVRQIERDFLKRVQDVLDYFESDAAQLLDIWLEGESCIEQLELQEMPGESALLEATIHRVFADSPRGVAKSLADEGKMDGWLERLRRSESLWFGGVDVAEFLNESVEKEDEAEFFTHLVESREFKIDHGAKRIFPAKTNLTATIRGILRSEENPIPLTWLIVLLEETGLHPGLTRNDLVRRRKDWEASGTFPNEKIIWDQ